MSAMRFDFSNLSKVKDGLRENLLKEYMAQEKKEMEDEMLDYAAAAGSANYLLRNKADGRLTAAESEALKSFLNVK